MKKRSKIIIAVSCSLAGILAISAMLMFIPIKTSKVMEKNEDDIRIVSYNLKNAYHDLETFDERKLVIQEQVLAYYPDSIGFQEADGPWMRYDNDPLSTSDGLPGLLKDYDYVGSSRTDLTWEYAPIFYLKDKYELLDFDTIWLNEGNIENEPTWGEEIDQRIITFATLKNKETGFVYTHFNTHFGLNDLTQTKSTEYVVSLISNHQYPSFLTGDLNFYAPNNNYNKLVSENLKDARKEADKVISIGTINWFIPINTHILPIIDYVFFTEKYFDSTYYHVDNNYWFNGLPVSDHFPVIADFKIK